MKEELCTYIYIYICIYISLFGSFFFLPSIYTIDIYQKISTFLNNNNNNNNKTNFIH